MGAERRMNLHEFTILMNNAFAFLGVTVNDEGCKAIFLEADTNHDGYLSYEEYFAIQKEILIIKPEPIVDPNQATEWISLLRQYLWAQCRRIYDLYDKDHNQKLDVKEFGNILKAIMSEYSDADIIDMITRSFKLNFSADGYLRF